MLNNSCNETPNSLTNPNQDEPNSPSLKATTTTENSEQEENDKKKKYGEASKEFRISTLKHIRLTKKHHYKKTQCVQSVENSS